MDSIIPVAVLSVSSLVNNLLASAKNAKELAKQSSDPDLKDRISDIFDTILDVKERVLDLDHENRSLREQLLEKTIVERHSSSGGFYKKGEIDPLCPQCYQRSLHAVVYLVPSKSRPGFASCIICGTTLEFFRRPLPNS